MPMPKLPVAKMLAACAASESPFERLLFPGAATLSKALPRTDNGF